MSDGSADVSLRAVDELKTLVQGLRDMVQNIASSQSLAQDTVHGHEEQATPGTASDEPIDTLSLVSELPDANSCRDYVNQYWKANPACHQNRACFHMSGRYTARGYRG
ncbi:hypothetical protein PHYSODRAFT_332552 [Phytophthora sojae]|uniref:Uncharacterized protein n=1 Tax=Phytophthora sojae (strain P6497) TaxID=1094619 RepID=G4ZJ11_PHYSP|nr:hypothetical protein PHYSODRAFT_332552 [Phytophthora sojae]EGZ18816.1 hypothetical protein PHYSODRAFT_332552 [Phytophthora sojae]|eukprot:XP_009527874.1 hypothetical protein PHYSODRAFT_332552 [Phytophthora sojae]